MISASLSINSSLSLLDHVLDDKVKAGLARAAAESYAEDMLDWIAEGKAFTSRTGATEQSIGWRGEGLGAIVYANAETAPWLEFGTGLHGPRQQRYVIKPLPDGGRKALKIPMGGGIFLYRKLINHPGMKASPFFFADVAGRKARAFDRADSFLQMKLQQL